MPSSRCAPPCRAGWAAVPPISLMARASAWPLQRAMRLQNSASTTPILTVFPRRRYTARYRGMFFTRKPPPPGLGSVPHWLGAWWTKWQAAALKPPGQSPAAVMLQPSLPAVGCAPTSWKHAAIPSRWSTARAGWLWHRLCRMVRARPGAASPRISGSASPGYLRPQ